MPEEESLSESLSHHQSLQCLCEALCAFSSLLYKQVLSPRVLVEYLNVHERYFIIYRILYKANG